MATLNRELLILDNEENPLGSKSNTVYPKTILDQVIDDKDPTLKTLRTIIEELKELIASGGNIVINFPVTSVNGKMGAVVIDKNGIGLDRVDNTSDDEKPLSDVQRSSIMEILRTYDFDIDLSSLTDHITNNSNPHNVTIEQLDTTGGATEFINQLIQSHNTNNNAHPDIKNTITNLNRNMETLSEDVDQRINSAVNDIGAHYDDENAHSDIMARKENSNLKVPIMNDDNINYDNYPSTRAVSEYVGALLAEITAKVDDLSMLSVVYSRSQLPQLSSLVYNNGYLIINGENGTLEFAVCKKNGSDELYWDITDTQAYTKYNSNQFTYDNAKGLSIDLTNVSTSMSENETFHSVLETLVREIIEIDGSGEYYTKHEIDAKGFITALTMERGTVNGTIRFYINNDRETMSEDIPVAGLKTLAYKNKIGEDDIEPKVVSGDQIKNDTITMDNMADKSVGASQLTANHMTVFGNVSDSENKTVEEISIRALAELFSPTFRDILEGTGLIVLKEEDVERIATEIYNTMSADISHEYIGTKQDVLDHADEIEEGTTIYVIDE